MNSGVYSSLIAEYKRLVGLGLNPVAFKISNLGLMSLVSELVLMGVSSGDKPEKFYGMTILIDEFLSVPRILVDADNVPEFSWM